MFLFQFHYHSSPLPDLRLLSLVTSISMVRNKDIHSSLYLYPRPAREMVLNFILLFGMCIVGKAGVQFYTQIKTITQQWKDLPAGSGVSLAMPTSQK